MHPDIMKFWESFGYRVVSDLPKALSSDVEWRVPYFLKKEGMITDIAAVSDVYKGKIPSTIKLNYYYQNRIYSEEQMLKIIKMIAFA